MFIYKYHRMTTKVSGIGITEYRFENMRDVIDKYANDGWRYVGFVPVLQRDKYANDGWRYVGFVPVLQRGNGYIEEIELIFEKEKS